ncbi:MAG: hypothetical protein ACREJU_07105 [Nitrospiraceae bacterium]
MTPNITHTMVEDINMTEGRIAVAPADDKCARCGGLMVHSRYIDLLDDTGQLEFTAERCIQCGDVVDPVIRHNRVRQAAANHCPPSRELGRVA